MTPEEEQYNQQIWEILQDIKQRSYLAEDITRIVYNIPEFLLKQPISYLKIMGILRKLLAWKCFKLIVAGKDIWLISLNDYEFNQKYQEFQELCNNKSNNSNEYSESNEIEEKFDWTDRFHWIDDYNFYLDEGKILHFVPKQTYRLKVFKILTEAKGSWVKVSSTANTLKKSGDNIRSIVSQLNKRLTEYKIIHIGPLGKKEKPGAYRIIFI